jgi:hypothetical protein
MASRNQYLGYIKLPKKKTQEMRIRLDFNKNVYSESGSARLMGFSLRLFVSKRIVRGRFKEEHPEIGVTLRPEEWLDLIDAMKQEAEAAFEARKRLDDSR